MSNANLEKLYDFMSLKGYENERAGQWHEVEIELSLTERIQMLLGSQPDEFLRYLRLNSEAYEIMCAEDVFRSIAWLPKPMAEILDDFRVPRVRTKSIPFTGPLQPLYGPFRPGPKLRRIVPHFVMDNEIVVQPMVDPTPQIFSVRAFDLMQTVIKSITELRTTAQH